MEHYSEEATYSREGITDSTVTEPQFKGDLDYTHKKICLLTTRHLPNKQESAGTLQDQKCQLTPLNFPFHLHSAGENSIQELQPTCKATTARPGIPHLPPAPDTASQSARISLQSYIGPLQLWPAAKATSTHIYTEYTPTQGHYFKTGEGVVSSDSYKHRKLNKIWR